MQFKYKSIKCFQNYRWLARIEIPEKRSEIEAFRGYQNRVNTYLVVISLIVV